MLTTYIEPTNSEQTLADDALFATVDPTQDVVLVAISRAVELAKHIDTRNNEAAITAYASRVFQAAVVAAYIADKHWAIRGHVQDRQPALWKRVKGAYSSAVKLADALQLNADGFVIPVQSKKERTPKPVRVGGVVLVPGAKLGKGALASLADPQFGDTPISTLLSKVVFPKAEQPIGDVELLTQEPSAEWRTEFQRRIADPVMRAELLAAIDAANLNDRAGDVAMDADVVTHRAAA
jgi:hypothetical protein